MGLKTIRPLACLCWRTVKPNRVIKMILCRAITLPDAAAASSYPPPSCIPAPPLEKCSLNLGACRGYYKSLWLTFACLAAVPEKKTHSHSGSGLSLLCSFQVLSLPPRAEQSSLVWTAAGSIPRMPNHQCITSALLKEEAGMGRPGLSFLSVILLDALIPQISLLGTYLISQQISKHKTKFRSSKSFA